MLHAVIVKEIPYSVYLVFYFDRTTCVETLRLFAVLLGKTYLVAKTNIFLWMKRITQMY